MAHHIKVRTVPHKNKDGTLSKTKRDHQVWDRHRGNKRLVGVCSSAKAAQELIEDEWQRIQRQRNNNGRKNR